MWDTPTIVLITGIMAAGKSTVAEELARRLPRSVHLRGDLFRRMVVNGRAEMTAELSEEAWRADPPRIGLWLDTSEQTPAQTVDEILGRAWTEGRIG